MGIYDCYGTAQLKVGDPSLQSFQIGDEVPISDGVYIDYNTIIVIKDGKFLAEFGSLITKWNDIIDLSTVLAPYNQMLQAIKDNNESINNSLKE